MATVPAITPVTPDEAMDYGNRRHKEILDRCMQFVNTDLCERGKRIADGDTILVAPSTQEFPLYGHFVACISVLAERFGAAGWTVKVVERPSESPYPPKTLTYLEFSK